MTMRENQLAPIPNNSDFLRFSWRRSLSYRRQSMDWFLYDRNLHNEKELSQFKLTFPFVSIAAKYHRTLKSYTLSQNDLISNQ